MTTTRPPGTATLKLWFDGGCRPNPGRMETMVVARGVAHHDAGAGQGDNNEAEWCALLAALRVARSLDADDIVLLGDSALVIAQAAGRQKCRTPRLRERLADYQRLAAGFARVRLRHVARSHNLAGIALDRLRDGVAPPGLVSAARRGSSPARG